MKAPAAPLRRDVPRIIWAWALYDWANSAFSAVVVTFVYATYFTQAIAPDEVTGTAWWSRAVAVSSLLTACLSPVLGRAADQSGAHKPLLAVTTALSILATALLTFVRPGVPQAALLALALFVVADMCLETSYTFYNALLPAIVSPARMGRVSGYAWGLGYAGGLVCLGIALAGFVGPDAPWLRLSTVEGFNIRAINLLVAGWFAVFALPLFLVVPAQPASAARIDVGAVVRGLMATLGHVRRYREAFVFLIARLIFNDGLVTVFAFGGVYAAGTFGMPLSEVIIFGMVLNFVSGVGSLAFGFLDDRIGGKNTIMVTLVALTLATAAAVVAPDRTWFWAAGIAIGLFVGPNQSASRSLMARFVPEAQQAEFFGFFAISGKALSFLGPLLLGVVTTAAGSQRAGVATILLFFIVGGIIMATVNEARGIETARAARS